MLVRRCRIAAGRPGQRTVEVILGVFQKRFRRPEQTFCLLRRGDSRRSVAGQHERLQLANPNTSIRPFGDSDWRRTGARPLALGTVHRRNVQIAGLIHGASGPTRAARQSYRPLAQTGPSRRIRGRARLRVPRPRGDRPPSAYWLSRGRCGGGVNQIAQRSVPRSPPNKS